MDVIPDWPDLVSDRTRRLGERYGPRWVVAVSGGSDSVGLLRLLHGAGLDLSVAHLDHGARGDDSAGDARFVADLAGSLGLPFDLGRWRPERPAHFEADARKARYTWLAGVARERGASAVAVGHTRDDQAETILHRILRGTGPRGLAGMPKMRRLGESVTLVRPLLDVDRDALRGWLVGLGQPWREDASNLDVARTRVRVRHDLLPRLAREYNPEVAGAIVRLGKLTRAAFAGLDEYIDTLARSAIRPGRDGTLALDRSMLAGLSSVLRAEVLRGRWREAGWPEAAMDARRWARLTAWAARGAGRIDVGAGVRGELEGDVVVLSRRSEATPPPAPEPAPLAIPGAAGWLGGRVVATIAGPDDPIPPGSERLDLDRLVPPLVVDSARPGDRFGPLGLDGRTTPLADFLRGRRVPREGRPVVPIVRDALGIVWVVGHRIGHRARCTDSTRRVALLRWEEEKDKSTADDADLRR